MIPTLHIQLLGEFRLWRGDRPLSGLARPRQQELLAYLLLHRHAPQPRQQIAFHFWPDSSESQAFTNLRKLYFQLRQALPHADSFLYTDTQYLGWRSDAPFTLDVAELELALGQLEDGAAPEPTLVKRVSVLYRGELLPTCYEEWLLPIRRSLHERMVRVLGQALVGLEAQREVETGLRVAEHLLRLDPLHEATYRHLMHLRALRGDRAGALRVYHECVTVLDQELGVPPATETQALYQHLLKTESPPTAVAKPAPAPPSARVPLVGRKAEWQALQQAWRQAAQGTPHLMVVWGEAGVGKTRLVEELRHWAGLRPGSVAYARAYAAEGALSYAPVTDLLRSAALRPVLSRLDPLWQTELARLLPELLAENPSLPPPLPMSEGWQRQRFYEALARTVLAAPAPLLLVLDDLQWCDGETLAWLHYLLRFDPQAPLLVVGTARIGAVDERHPLHDLLRHLRQQEQCSEVQLAPLTAQETATLAGHLSQEDVTAWAEPLYRETEGNPLFVVEMVRAGFPAAQQMGQTVPLPQTVQAVIQTRLGQLSPSARQLTHLAATMGRAFAVEVLAAAGELSEDALVPALDELWQRRLVREQANGYDFSHDKIREVAYAELAPIRRQWLHRRIGAALAQCYADRLDEVVGELAVHAEQAGQMEQAFGYLRRAAEVAQRIGAYPEAILRLRKALTLLPSLPVTPAAALHEELAVLVPLGACLVALRGYGDAEVEATYKRAHQLLTQLGDDPNFMPILVGLALFHLIRGELQQALAIGQQSLRLAQRLQDEGLLVEAHLVVGPVLQYLGNFRASVPHLEQVLALYDPARHQDHVVSYGHEPGATGRVILAISLWFLGEIDRSLQLMQEGLALAQQGGHQYTLNLAQTYHAQLRHLRREPAAEQAAATAGLELACRQGFQYWQVILTMFWGWAEAQLSAAAGAPGRRSEELLAKMHEAFTGFQQTGAGLLTAYYLGVMAEAQVAAQAVETGWATLQQALAVAATAEDRFNGPGLQHLRGELLLARGESGHSTAAVQAEAEAAFLQAIQTARQQEARVLELRAATSLARLWMRQGRRTDAHTLLAPVFAGLSEGFDTPDVQEAAALLRALA